MQTLNLCTGSKRRCEIPVSILAQAASIRAPIAGIPRNGGRPFAIHRDRLKHLLENDGDVIVQESRWTEQGDLYLRFQPCGSGSTCKVVLYDQNRINANGVKDTLAHWAQAQRGKAQKANLPKAERKAIRLGEKSTRLERKLRKMGEDSHRPYHCLIDAAEHSDVNEWERTAWLTWHNSKPLRKRLSKIAAQVGVWELGLFDSRHFPSRALYAAVEAAGIQVKRYSSLSNTTRHPRPFIGDYAKSLYLYAGGSGKPWDSKPETPFDLVAMKESRAKWLTENWQRNQLKDEITDLKARSEKVH